MKTTRIKPVHSKDLISYTDIKQQPYSLSLIQEDSDPTQSKRMSEISSGYHSGAHQPNKDTKQFIHSQYFTPKHANDSLVKSSKARDQSTQQTSHFMSEQSLIRKNVQSPGSNRARQQNCSPVFSGKSKFPHQNLPLTPNSKHSSKLKELANQLNSFKQASIFQPRNMDLPIRSDRSSETYGSIAVDPEMHENVQSMITNREFKFKTPFQYKETDDPNKFSPVKGFGKKTSLERDKHTLEMNRSIDNAIENVATVVNIKEIKIKEINNLKCNKIWIGEQNNQIRKEIHKVEESIEKEIVKIQAKQEANSAIKFEIDKYRKKVDYYHKVIQKQNKEQEEKEQLKVKLDEKVKKIKDDVMKDCTSLQQQEQLIERLTQKVEEKERELYQLKKKSLYASKLENERIHHLKSKEKILLSVIEEEKLTIRYGNKLSQSPLGKKVRALVSGRKLK